MRLNKACEAADLTDPELLEVIREVFPHRARGRDVGVPADSLTREDWEVAMPLLALRRLGFLSREAVVLVVSASPNDSVFYLTRQVRQVFFTEQYRRDPSTTRAWPPLLVEPSLVAPGEFEDSRLVTQHMDPRVLRFPDLTFDAVLSWGSEALVGLTERDDVANAAYEMGRVLKPGGILAITTQILLGGPPPRAGEVPRHPFSADELRRYVVEASGLEPVEELSLATPGDTLAAMRQPDWANADSREFLAAQRGYVIGSVHLSMRRSTSYPHTPNDWARPAAETLDAVTRANLRLLTSGESKPATADVEVEGPGRLPEVEPARVRSWADLRTAAATGAGSLAANRELAIGHLTALVDGSTESLRHLDQLSEAQAQVEALLGRVSRLRTAVAGLPRHVPLDDERRVNKAPPALDRPSWKVCRTSLATGKEIKVVVDAGSDDPVSAAFQAGGEGGLYEHQLTALMLELVEPGDVVLDLGAHVGTFSLSAAAEGCRVVALEASPLNADLLRASASANRFHSLRVVAAAAGDHGGSVEFFAHGPWGHVVESGADGPRVTVPCVTVDDLLDEMVIPKVAFVKMDIEGSEIAAIRGMRRLLEPADGPPLLYESNGHTLAFFGATPEDLVRELSRLGYTSYMAEPPRLIRVTPDEWQPQTLVNYLAFKHPPETLSGWRFDPGLTSQERVRRVVAECQEPNSDQRAYIAGALQRAPRWILDDPAITTALTRLRLDPVPTVRDAAQWSSQSGTGGF